MKDETKIGLVKEWGSPRSNIQLFVPQEYVAACTQQIIGWKAYGSMIIKNEIYHDKNGNGLNDYGEDVKPNSGNWPGDASSDPNSNYFHSTIEPTDVNDGTWYTGYTNTGSWLRPVYTYTGQITTHIYKHNNHYFSSYELVYGTDNPS